MSTKKNSFLKTIVLSVITCKLNALKEEKSAMQTFTESD